MFARSTTTLHHSLLNLTTKNPILRPQWKIPNRSLSTPTTPTEPNKGFFQRIKTSIEGRSKTKQDAEYAKQVLQMSNKEQWDLASFSEQINNSVGGWRRILLNMSNTQAMTNLKKSQKIIDAAKTVLGDDATVDVLKTMDKTSKLRIAVDSEHELADINSVLQQFESMEVMHRILRYRKLHGKPMPDNEESTKTLLQVDLPKVITPKEKKEMRRLQAKNANLGMRR